MDPLLGSARRGYRVGPPQPSDVSTFVSAVSRVPACGALARYWAGIPGPSVGISPEIHYGPAVSGTKPRGARPGLGVFSATGTSGMPSWVLTVGGACSGADCRAKSAAVCGMKAMVAQSGMRPSTATSIGHRSMNLRTLKRPMLTITQRQTLFALAAGHLDQTAEAASAAQIRLLAELPPRVRRSITYSQGRKLVGHKPVADQAGLTNHCCGSHGLWQWGPSIT